MKSHESSSTKEERWLITSTEIIKRVYFQPSIVEYWNQMAVNSFTSALSLEAKELSKIYEISKYYFRNLSIEEEFRDDPYSGMNMSPDTNGLELANSVIADIKQSATESSGKGFLKISRNKSIELMTTAVSNYLKRRRDILRFIAVPPDPEYPPEFEDKLILELVEQISVQESSIDRLQAALICRGASFRETIYKKAEGAEFQLSSTEDGTVVFPKLEGDPISPTLLGIEVGDTVIGDTSSEIVSTSNDHFVVSKSITSIREVVSRNASKAESGIGLCMGFYIRSRDLRFPGPNANPAQIVKFLKEVSLELQVIDSSLLPVEYLERIGIALESYPLESLLSRADSHSCQFSPEQRKAAIDTLDLLKSRGYDQIERDCISFKALPSIARTTLGGEEPSYASTVDSLMAAARRLSIDPHAQH